MMVIALYIVQGEVLGTIPHRIIAEFKISPEKKLCSCSITLQSFWLLADASAAAGGMAHPSGPTAHVPAHCWLSHDFICNALPSGISRVASNE